MFALIGLTKDVTDTFIDYNKELRDILVDLASIMLNTAFGKPLRLLSHAKSRPQSSDLPSWVPGWLEPFNTLIPLDEIFGESIYDDKKTFAVNSDKVR